MYDDYEHFDRTQPTGVNKTIRTAEQRTNLSKWLCDGWRSF